MEFRIADTFTASLGRLNAEEQKAAKTTAFDLQMNPASPGLQFHRIERARDKNFWSVRAGRDLRLIVHRTASSLMLCFVGHHDEAYGWAERRKLETHPTTGAAQLVEIHSVVRRVEVPVYVETPAADRSASRVFEAIPDETLLGYGVPPEWLDEVRTADEDGLLVLVDHLPDEAAEALLSIAVGDKPAIPEQQPEGVDPFQHPDAQRRFRVMASVEELERALEYPWEKWAVFLHPQQQVLVERDFKGPARVAGSAGTGKTVVALHRAVFLARSNPGSRVLLATFSLPLANTLRSKLRRLVRGEPRLAEQIEVFDMASLGCRLHELNIGPVTLAGDEHLQKTLRQVIAEVEDSGASPRFLATEWAQVVDAWQLATWEDYRDIPRLGRKTRLPEGRRRVIWTVLQRVREALAEQGVITLARVFSDLARHFNTVDRAVFDFAVIDESQDLTVSQLRFFAALLGDRPNGLFFAGDLGQRIFQQAFSWSGLGVEVRGRSHILRVNYRTSHQIRTQADRLLGPELADVDGNVESRRGTISVFNGVPPQVSVQDSEQDEITAVAKWLEELLRSSVVPHEMAVFVRSELQMGRAMEAVRACGFPYVALDDSAEGKSGHIAVGTMHRAKGLEFRAVAVMACDDEVIPLQERIETAADESDLREVYDTERHLLYVACTRARDHLLVTGVDPTSEFLSDLDEG